MERDGDARWKAGAARACITPEQPCWIAGYEPNRRSGGVHSDLWASVLVLDNGRERVGLVALDLIGLHYPFVQQIRERVRSLSPDRLMIGCTHVHSGPDTIGIWGPEPGVSGVDPVYMAMLLERIPALVEEAAERLAPAELYFSAGAVDGVSRNARIPGLLDKTVSILHVREADGEPLATAVNFACHPEAMHCRRLSADFPATLYEKASDAGLGIPLYFNGALGGMVTADIPSVPTPEDQVRETGRIGALFADEVIALTQIARESGPCPSRRLSFQTQRLCMPLQNVRYEAMEAAGVVPSRFPGHLIETEAHRLLIGPSEWVTLPGEATPDIGFYLRRHMAGFPTFVVGICDDELGYLLCEEHWGTPLFAYESSMCPSPSAGRRIEAALLQLMKGEV